MKSLSAVSVPFASVRILLAHALVTCAAVSCTPSATTNGGDKTPDAVTTVAEHGDPVAAPKTNPFLLDGGELLAEEQLPVLKGPKPVVAEVSLLPAPKGVPAAPASCNAFVNRKAPAATACADAAAALPLLGAALEKSGDERDAALAALEACKGLEPGIVRAIRVEVAPPECADVMAEPILAKKPKELSGSVEHALIGLALSARLHRTASTPPVLAPPFETKKVDTFVKKQLFPWFNDQAVAIQELSKQGSQLSSYGKGVVALAAGWADLRMVDVLRESPVPDDFRTDPEKGSVYFAALDEQLEPRKTRGRDAALVGIREMAAQGILVDDRTSRTRGLLAKLYGGRRVDSLDVLFMPAARTVPSKDALGSLASRLPTFYAGLLLDPNAVLSAPMIAAFAQRGIPTPMRAALKESEDKLTDDARLEIARFKLMMGLRYWRSVDFDAAVAQLSKLSPEAKAADGALLHGVALALRKGPADVATLMLQVEPFGPKFGDVRALDWVRDEKPGTPEAGYAAFNGAVIRQIATPRDADAAYWTSLKERYETASKLLPESQRNESLERARSAEATAKVLAKSAQ